MNMIANTPFKKVVRLGTQKEYNRDGILVNADIFCKIEYTGGEKGKLSISGVIGPKSNGDALGSCGQICMGLSVDEISPAKGWGKTKIKQFLSVWDQWHLNDMSPATKAMKDAGWLELAEKPIYKYSYSLTMDSRKWKEDIEARLKQAAIKGEPCILPEQEKRLLMTDRSKDIYGYETPEAPEFMEPRLDYRTKEHKIERKTLGWVYPSEHPDGLLGKELNGEKYGGAWYFEHVPVEVLEFLTALPNSDKIPAWV